MTEADIEPTVEAFDARRAVGAQGLLATFNEAGVLAAADVHVASRLAALAEQAAAAAAAAAAAPDDPDPDPDPGDDDDGDAAPAGGDDADAVRLAIALAVRAPRLGHVCTDLATVHETVTTEGDVPVDLRALPWPPTAAWIEAVAASPLVATSDDAGGPRPLRLLGTRLYLDRYWREERAIADDLRARAAAAAGAADPAVLDGLLERIFPGGDEPDLQREAAAAAVQRRFTVVAGGPGTGKTTTVASILALLVGQAAATGQTPPRVALAAPTGKAAARLEEAVHREAAKLHARGAIDDDVRDHLLGAEASTLHRLLGWRPGSRSRFRHDRANRLPHDAIVVDETSMVSLSLMARLVAAVRDGARLILVGDPDQLASVEAGAVLGDLVGPAREAGAAAQAQAQPPAPAPPPAPPPPPAPAQPPAPAPAPIADAIVVLRRVHRYGPVLGRLAEAIQRGDEDGAVAALRQGDGPLALIDVDLAETRPSSAALDPVRAAVVAAARTVVGAAAAGDGATALAGLGAIRVLCAHRRGPYGVSSWTAQVERWLAAGVEGFVTGTAWYAGRPILVTENDYGLRVFNGDTGVIVAHGAGGVRAVFERRGALLEIGPHRLGAVDTVHAMTVHKAQGSQFDEVAVLLPDPASPILTRELLYTAITRARRRLVLAGTREALRAAVERPVTRASGLRDRLWG
jgi:exodeoxyribonuclease V alpha subunit